MSTDSLVLEPIVQKVRNPIDRELCIALLNKYHPHGADSRGFASVHSYWVLVDRNTEAFLAVALLTYNMRNVFKKANRLYFNNLLDYEEALFVKRIMSVPPFKVAGELLIGIGREIVNDGIKALFSFVYPGMEGKLYQFAKWKFGWKTGGYRFVYKDLRD